MTTLTREEKLKILECAALLVQTGLNDSKTLDGFKLPQAASLDPIGALSGVYDGIARLFQSKVAAEPAPG